MNATRGSVAGKDGIIGKIGSTLTVGRGESDNRRGNFSFRIKMAERMENGVQENQISENRAAEQPSAEEVGVRVDQAELATRPLSQFILSKEYAGVSANPELIRPVTLVAASRPAEVRQGAASPSAPAPTRRIEYPFYDDDDESDPEPETAIRENVNETPEPSADPEPVESAAAGPEVLELSADRPVAPPQPTAAIEPEARDIPFQPVRLPNLLISHSVVSADELTAPLPGARVRSGEFPILDYFLKAVSRRR